MGLSCVNLSLICQTSDASIYYTLDGSSPTTGSFPYISGISVIASELVKTFAVKNGLNNSLVTSGNYIIDTSGLPAAPINLELIPE